MKATPRTPTAIDAAFDAWQASSGRYMGAGPSDLEVRCMLSYLVGMLAQRERQGDLDAKTVAEIAYAFERHTPPRGTAFEKHTGKASERTT